MDEIEENSTENSENSIKKEETSKEIKENKEGMIECDISIEEIEKHEKNEEIADSVILEEEERKPEKKVTPHRWFSKEEIEVFDEQGLIAVPKKVITITDKNGKTYNKNITYSRFNRFISGKYSKFKHLYCSSCYLQTRCELFKQGSICGYLPQFQRFPYFETIKDNPDSILKQMHRLLKDRFAQLKRAEFFARMDGGVIDKEVESIRSQFYDELKDYYALITNKPDTVIQVENDPLDKLIGRIFKDDGEIKKVEVIKEESVSIEKEKN